MGQNMTDKDAIANLTYRRDCWVGLKYVNNKPEPWISGVLEEAMLKGAEALKEREKIKKDLKWYLDTNEEDGVVYIPKFVIEKIVYCT